MKALSIIGIVLFFLLILLLMSGEITIEHNEDAHVMATFGLIGLLYALALAIVGLVISSKKKD